MQEQIDRYNKTFEDSQARLYTPEHDNGCCMVEIKCNNGNWQWLWFSGAADFADYIDCKLQGRL